MFLYVRQFVKNDISDSLYLCWWSNEWPIHQPEIEEVWNTTRLFQEVHNKLQCKFNIYLNQSQAWLKTALKLTLWNYVPFFQINDVHTIRFIKHLEGEEEAEPQPMDYKDVPEKLNLTPRITQESFIPFISIDFVKNVQVE